MPKVTVVDAIKRFSLDPARIGKSDTWIEYAVDGRRGYFVYLPEEEATPEAIEAAIRTAEVARQALLKIAFEV